LAEIDSFEDALLDAKESTVDPIRRFMTGPNRDLYSDARRFLRDQVENLAYVQTDAAEKIRNLIMDPACYKGNCMQQIKATLEELKAGIATQLNKEAEKAAAIIEALRDRTLAMQEFKTLKANQQQELRQVFEHKLDEVNGQRLIAALRDIPRRFEDENYPRFLEKMEFWNRSSSGDSNYPQPSDQGKGKIADPSYVPVRSVFVKFEKAWLADESDVDRYLDSIREALLAEIRKGKRIQI
jgi:hypothetical protein